jgi:hypothetical protein
MSAITDLTKVFAGRTPEHFDMTPATAEEIAAEIAAGNAASAAADGCMDSIDQLSMGLEFSGEKKRLIKYLRSVHTRFNSPGFEITKDLCAEMLLAYSDYSKILKEFEDSGKQIVRTMSGAVTDFKSLLADMKSLQDKFIKFYLQKGILEKLRETTPAETTPVEATPVEATPVEGGSDVPIAHIVAVPEEEPDASRSHIVGGTFGRSMTITDFNHLLDGAVAQLIDAAQSTR